MRGRISGKGKSRDNRGTGTGANYKPWIQTREISSSGTKSLLVDWKHGRQIHTLSRNETYFYYIQRWDDNVIDINEQYPLDRSKTERIADALSIMHPSLGNDPDERMTTDFLITKTDGRIIKKYAYSVKDKYEQVFGDIGNPEVRRLVEKQTIEMSYWKLQGIDFKVVFGDRDINKMLARNIELVVNHYNLKHVHTVYELMCFLIAHKYVDVQMDKTPIDIIGTTNTYLNDTKRVEFWLSHLVRQKLLSTEELPSMKKLLLSSVGTMDIPKISEDE